MIKMIKTNSYSKKGNVYAAMAACDNLECQIEWFHLNFVKLENIIRC